MLGPELRRWQSGCLQCVTWLQVAATVIDADAGSGLRYAEPCACDMTCYAQVDIDEQKQMKLLGEGVDSNPGKVAWA